MTDSIGLNEAQMHELERRFRSASAALDRSERVISAAISRTYWIGPDANAFRANWSSTLRPNIRSSSSRLDGQATALRQHIQDQLRTSASSEPVGAGQVLLAGQITGHSTAPPEAEEPESPFNRTSWKTGFFSGVEVERQFSWTWGRDDGRPDPSTDGDARNHTGVETEGSVHLAGGSVEHGATFAHVSVDRSGEFYGGTATGTATIDVGATARSQGSIDYKDGRLAAEGKVDVSAGITGVAQGTYRTGDLTAKASVGAFAGAEAQAVGAIGVGLSGVSAKVSMNAFAGVRADASASADFAGVTAKAGVGVSAGIGAHLDVDADIGLHRFKLKADLGATLGLGASIKFDVEVRPLETLKKVGSFLNLRR